MSGGVLTGFAMLVTSYPMSLPYIYLTYGVFVGTFGSMSFPGFIISFCYLFSKLMNI
jgi:hypothetical protein